MQLEEKISFALSTVRPMAEYTLPYLASVIGVVDLKVGQHLGSAFRCILGGRRALVTALHVLEGAARYQGLAFSAGYGVPPYRSNDRPHYQDQEADLAIYLLPDDYPGGGVAFWPEEKVERNEDRLGTDYLFVHGFPGARSYSSRLLEGVVSKSLPYGVMQRLEEEPGELRLQPFQFAVHFDPRNIRVAPGEPKELLPDPHGLSGSPVWRIGASGRSARDWSPDWSRFVGLITQWRTDTEILVATKAMRIIQLINQA